MTRFDRTYKAHNIKKIALKAPMVVFYSVYFPAKILRAIHSATAAVPEVGERQTCRKMQEPARTRPSVG